MKDLDKYEGCYVYASCDHIGRIINVNLMNRFDALKSDGYLSHKEYSPVISHKKIFMGSLSYGIVINGIIRSRPHRLRMVERRFHIIERDI